MYRGFFLYMLIGYWFILRMSQKKNIFLFDNDSYRKRNGKCQSKENVEFGFLVEYEIDRIIK